MIDIRNAEPLLTLEAHEGSVNAIAMSSSVPNLLCTGSEEEIVKIWDLTASSIDLVYEKKFKIV